MKKIPGCMLISAAVVGCVLVSGCETSDYTDNVTTGCVDETGEIAETDYNISIYDSFETDIFIDMEENNEDGADWRTTGIIIDYGTITRNGKSVDVVVTLDKPRQINCEWRSLSQAPWDIPKGYRGTYYLNLPQRKALLSYR